MANIVSECEFNASSASYQTAKQHNKQERISVQQPISVLTIIPKKQTFFPPDACKGIQLHAPNLLGTTSAHTHKWISHLRELPIRFVFRAIRHRRLCMQAPASFLRPHSSLCAASQHALWAMFRPSFIQCKPTEAVHCDGLHSFSQSRCPLSRLPEHGLDLLRGASFAGHGQSEQPCPLHCM